MNGLRNTSLLTRSRKRQLGLTMPEIMLGLSLIAVVSIGAITAYNQVAPRVAGNNLLAGMNAFLVDVAQYTTQFHTDQPEGIAEATATQDASNTKAWAAAPTGVIGMLATTTVPNPNTVRIANMPSLTFSDGDYDQDPVAEWHIPISETQGIEVAFSILPDPAGAGVWAPASWPGCDINDNATLPDTALLVQAALENKATCDYVAQSIERMDHVSNAWCSDEDTTPLAPAALTGMTGVNANTNGTVALNMCFSVMR